MPGVDPVAASAGPGRLMQPLGHTAAYSPAQSAGGLGA